MEAFAGCVLFNIAIHADELDGVAYTCHGTELLRAEVVSILEVAAIIGWTIFGQLNETELHAVQVAAIFAQITHDHAFEEIHPAEDRSPIRETQVGAEAGRKVQARGLQGPSCLAKENK